MKQSLITPGRFALTAVAAAAMWLSAPAAMALGLGRLGVQSALGEALRAEIDITSLSRDEASTLQVRIAPPESYRAAGVDYNSVLPNTTTQLLRRPDGRPYLRIASDRPVQEPFVDVILEMTWASGRLVREYTLLIDPPTHGTRADGAVHRVVDRTGDLRSTGSAVDDRRYAIGRSGTIGRRRRVAAGRPAYGWRSPHAARRARASAAAQAPRPVAPAAAAAPSAQVDEYVVKQGDTLYRIATRTQRSGVSLDQMLVSLFRGNPQAFIDNNMNLLKAGATSEGAECR